MPTVPTSFSTRIHSCSLVNFSIFARSLSAAVIAMGNERQGSHQRRTLVVADHELKRRGGRGGGSGDIAHRHRRAERRAETAAGDLADLGTLPVEDLGVLARRRLFLRRDADAFARDAGGELLLHDRGAGIAALAAAARRDGP